MSCNCMTRTLQQECRGILEREAGREKKMNIAYRFRIYQTENRKSLLAKTFGCCRFYIIRC
ncbi:MAG: helix-turn-helix domain-containing protein [Lachnospiraceae bacterium]